MSGISMCGNRDGGGQGLWLCSSSIPLTALSFEKKKIKKNQSSKSKVKHPFLLLPKCLLRTTPKKKEKKGWIYSVGLFGDTDAWISLLVHPIISGDIQRRSVPYFGVCRWRLGDIVKKDGWMPT